MDTSCGSFTITLDPEQSPNGAASFYSLAQKGFYDDTIFHRIVQGFLIQGGDPSQQGTEGPGYTTVDTPPTDASYTARHGRDGEDRRRRRRAPAAASSSSSPRTTPASRPTTRSSATSPTGSTSSTRSASSADPTSCRREVVVIDKATVETS